MQQEGMKKLFGRGDLDMNLSDPNGNQEDNFADLRDSNGLINLAKFLTFLKIENEQISHIIFKNYTMFKWPDRCLFSANMKIRKT